MMVINSLSAHPCFKTLDPESCRVLDRHCIWHKTAAGQWLLGQTANDRDVYFVMTGRLRAVHRSLPEADTDRAVFDSIEREIEDEVHKCFPGDAV